MDLKDGREKLLIITELRDVLGRVHDHLEQWGFGIREVHGGINPSERLRAQEVFRTGAQVCESPAARSCEIPAGAVDRAGGKLGGLF